ncbi:MAG: hypothetical protein AMXMBFR34_40250 [Myxococcaceae bacterium]
MLERVLRVKGPAQWLHGDRPTVRDVFFVHAAGLASAALAFGLADGTALRRSLLALLAWDVVGGVIAHHSASTSTWYAAQPRSARYLFLVLHVAPPLLLGWLDHRPSAWGVTVWATTLFVVALVGTVKRAWQWPAGAFGAAVVCLVVFSVYKPSPLALFYVPFFALKLAAGFAVPHTGKKR